MQVFLRVVLRRALMVYPECISLPGGLFVRFSWCGGLHHMGR